MPEPFAIYDRQTRTIVHTCATPHEVALWLWGRSCLRHVIYQGECPYYFQCADIHEIAQTLTQFPSTSIRQALPMHLLSWWNTNSLVEFCQIGGTDPRPEEPPPCPQ